jgi:hypothetical protein
LKVRSMFIKGQHIAIMTDPKNEEGSATEAVVTDKPDRTIVTEHGEGGNGKDDCSDLTDNNVETDESSPKSFPQKVSLKLPQVNVKRL